MGGEGDRMGGEEGGEGRKKWFGGKGKRRAGGGDGEAWGPGDGKRGREDVGRTGEVNEQECGEADATQVWLWQRRVLYVNGFDVCKMNQKQ